MKIINDFIKNIKIKKELKNELKILYTQLYHLNRSSLCEYYEYDEPRMLYYDFTSNSCRNELFPTDILSELKKTNVDIDTTLKIASAKMKEICDLQKDWEERMKIEFIENIEQEAQREKKSQLKNSFYAHYTRSLNDDDDDDYDDKKSRFDISYVSKQFSRIRYECAFSIRASVKERIFAIEKQLEKM